MMRLVVSAALLTIALASCQGRGQSTSPTAAIAPGVPTQLSSAQIKIVQENVRKALKDPESARFGVTKAAKSDKDVVTVCGFVNAKNSYGGYTGEKPFLGTLLKSGGFVVISAGGDDASVSASLEVCKASGISL